MAEKVILNKEAFIDQLGRASVNVEDLPPVRAGFALDISGSTNADYYNGLYQRILEQVFPVALALDDNGTMETVTFDDNAYRKPDINMDNYGEYIARYVYPKGTNFRGGTKYAPPLEMLSEEYFPSLTSMEGAKKMLSGFASRLMGKKEKAELPALIFVSTDGQSFDEERSYELIQGLKDKPLFIIFLGIGISGGSSDSKYLTLLKEKFPYVDSHLFPNGSFKTNELYDRIVSGKFVKWLKGL